MKRSDWMEGLLWVEEYIEKGVFFADDPIGLDSLYWEVYYSGQFSEEFDGEFMKGAADYMKHFGERLL